MPDHPDHPGRVPDTDHLDLGDGLWADLRRSLTNGQAQQVEAAQLVADYDTRGEFRRAKALVQSVLAGAPEEWRKEHLDNTLGIIDFALDAYEETSEAALATVEQRQRQAESRIALQDVYARVFTAAWSVRDSEGGAITDTSADAWLAVDGRLTRRVSQRAQALWRDWNRELRERLKGDAAISPASDE